MGIVDCIALLITLLFLRIFWVMAGLQSRAEEACRRMAAIEQRRAEDFEILQKFIEDINAHIEMVKEAARQSDNRHWEATQILRYAMPRINDTLATICDMLHIKDRG